MTPIKSEMNNVLFSILVAVSFLQIIGFSLGIKGVRGLGLATVASPLPLVFSHFRGHETFAAKFSLELYKDDRLLKTVKIDSALYSKLKGPYNRRNVFGAAFAYGPYLDQNNERELVRSVLSYGFCSKDHLPSEFEIEEDFDRIVVVVVPTKAEAGASNKVSVTCQ